MGPYRSMLNAVGISPFVASITWRARAGSAPGPNTGERSLLSDPRFILEPDFQWFAAGFRRRCRRYQLREVFFECRLCGRIPIEDVRGAPKAA